MSAVVRIKRRLNEDKHSDAFILKKRKIDNNTPETSTVLRFAGTVDQKNSENITKDIANFQLTKDAARDIVTRKRPESGLNSRINQNREKSQQNRFRIVNCNRLEESPEVTSAMTIVDVEREPQLPAATTADVATTSSSSFSDLSEEPYVYDLYIADSNNGSIQYTDLNDLSILDYNDHLYSGHRLVQNRDDDEESCTSDDSNAEDYYRNDYPDDEQDSDIDEMGDIVNGLRIGNELSSDDECDDGFVYSIDSEGFAFEDDLDYGYVDRRGEGYARYHRKVRQELAADSSKAGDDDNSEHDNNNNEDEDDYYSD